MPLKPCLKWVGGKTQILDKVFALFPATMRSYHEPFVGGGSVLIELLERRRAGTLTLTGTIYASDLNPHLITLYQTIQQSPTELIAALQRLAATYTACTGTVVNRAPLTEPEGRESKESYYYWIRARFNTVTLDPVERAATFLFLNKTCFRGLYREGPRGFNVPFGHYKNPGIYEEATIRGLSALFADVVFTHAPFTQSLAATRVQAGDFVYLDPPYAPIDATSFTGYTAAGFDAAAHDTLFKEIAGIPQKGASALMSNADVELVRKAFPSTSYTTTTIRCKRSINSTNPAHHVNEVLVLTKS
jgi:DNA adenine methylase